VKFRALMFALILSTLCSEGFAQSNSQSQFQIKRAVNVETFIALRPKVNGRLESPYYDLQSVSFGRKNPKALKDAGFDSVRLAIEPAPLLYMSEAERSNVYPIFGDAIRDFIASGLTVIFDLHMTDRDPVWNLAALTAKPPNDKFERYLEVIASVSHFLKSYDSHSVALELFNEPPCNDPELWSQLQKRMYRVARDTLADHTLILTGPCSSIDGLQQIHIGDYDNNTIFTFHFYEPAVFTHEGVPWIKDYKYIRRLPYPPEKDRADRSVAAMEIEVDADGDLNEVTKFLIKRSNRNAILKYVTTPMDGDWIKERIAKVRRWSDQIGLPPERIFLGEFGANRGWNGIETVAPEDRLRWLYDVRSIAEQMGFAWAVWSDCCTFGITANGADGALDSDVLKALGMAK
jgi:hypothetical protein